MPRHDAIKVGTHMIIGQKPYKVIDIDSITNDGIIYLSLDRDFTSKSADIVVEEIQPEEAVEQGILVAGAEITVLTQNGVFKTSRQVDVVRHGHDSVTFVVPYGVEELTVVTRNEETELETIYKVVL